MLLVNGTAWLPPLGGMQRYTREIAKALLRARNDCQILAPRPATDAMLLSHTRVLPLLSESPWLWTQLVLPRSIGSDDILWSGTHRAPLRARKHIVTIHDVAVFDHPEWFKPAFVHTYRYVIRAQVQNAAHVVTVSEFSKSRIVSVFGCDPDRITVIPNGVGDEFHRRSPDEIRQVVERYGIRPGFILAFNPSDPRKRFGSVRDAWSRLPAELKAEHPLVVLGGIRRAFAECDPASDAVHLGQVDDSDLPALFSAAEILVYPSVYEGFGLPPLEAMACETPVLLGTAQALVEYFGGAAHLLEQDSVHALTDALVSLLHDAAALRQYRVPAQRRAANLSWESAAARLQAVATHVSNGT